MLFYSYVFIPIATGFVFVAHYRLANKEQQLPHIAVQVFMSKQNYAIV